ncbi:MAG: hypothetical protein RL648_1336, partial [Verrucomicrobiota bacterium]
MPLDVLQHPLGEHLVNHLRRRET